MAAARRLQPPLRAATFETLIGLLAVTGMRIGELTLLELDCVHEVPGSGAWLKIPLGKLLTERMVPVDEETVEIIDRITEHRSPGRPLRHPRTARLAEVVSAALGPAAARQKIHPATRTFQALRIFVNDELGELERGLEAAERVLRAGGRPAVVAFHSLEDRIVKRFLAERSGAVAKGSRHAPEHRSDRVPTFSLITGRAVKPGTVETLRNPRARSARLRAAERLAPAA